MYATLLILGVLAGAAGDTTFAVSRTDRLRLALHEGNVTVRVWSRAEARVRAADGDASVKVSRDGADLVVKPHHRGGWNDSDLEVMVPAWLPLSISTHAGDVRIEGSEAAVSVESVAGEVTLTGGRGIVSITAVSGDVVVRQARGNLAINAINGDIDLSTSSGAVTAESVNGDITLRSVSSDAVQAESVNGSISFGGPVLPRGRYRLTTHNGDVTIGMAANTNATVTVNSYQGDFESTLPVRVSGSLDKRFTFVLGTGGARVELESFQGTVRIGRPDAATTR